MLQKPNHLLTKPPNLGGAIGGATGDPTGDSNCNAHSQITMIGGRKPHCAIGIWPFSPANSKSAHATAGCPGKTKIASGADTPRPSPHTEHWALAAVSSDARTIALNIILRVGIQETSCVTDVVYLIGFLFVDRQTVWREMAERDGRARWDALNKRPLVSNSGFLRL